MNDPISGIDLPEVDHERLGLPRRRVRRPPDARCSSSSARCGSAPRCAGSSTCPTGGVLIVSNHSGGLIAMDVPVIAVAFSEHFGRPPALLPRPRPALRRLRPTSRCAGPASSPPPARAAAASLRAGAATIVFPGGDYDAFRPTSGRNQIDFAGRTGYVRTAIEAGVPIVPVVSIGGQENQLHLSPRRAARQAVRAAEAAALEVPPGDLRLPVRPHVRRSRPTCRCPPRSSPGARADRHRRPSSGPTPTWPRSTAVVRERMQDDPRRAGRRPALPGPGLTVSASGNDVSAAAGGSLTTLVAQRHDRAAAPRQVPPDGRVVRRQGTNATTGLSLAAVRRPAGRRSSTSAAR